MEQEEASGGLSGPVRKYGEAPRLAMRPNGTAREAPIVNAMGTPSNAASRDVAPIECHCIYE